MNVSSQFVLPWGTFHQITANNTTQHHIAPVALIGAGLLTKRTAPVGGSDEVIDPHVDAALQFGPPSGLLLRNPVQQVLIRLDQPAKSGAFTGPLNCPAAIASRVPRQSEPCPKPVRPDQTYAISSVTTSAPRRV